MPVDEAKDIGDGVVDRNTGQGFTPGPWNVHDGVQANCKCLSVSGAGHPIAKVESGEWGDSYPSIRPMKDTGSIEGKFEAYIERIAYGEIPEAEALANARLIAAAPALFEELRHSALAVHTIGAHHHPSWVAFEECKKEICVRARRVLELVNAPDPPKS